MHVLVPGGGLTVDGRRWKRVPDTQFFLPQQKLAARFKGRLKSWLQAEHPQLLARVPVKVWWIKWVADVQAVGSGAAALKYLAHYVSRGPLHPSRIAAWQGQHVTFRYRDAEGIERPCTVSGGEFIRRLLQHVPPKSFQRVRHYGWLSGAAKTKGERILALLDWRAPIAQLLGTPEQGEGGSTKNSQPVLCASCGQPMRLIGTLARSPPGMMRPKANTLVPVARSKKPERDNGGVSSRARNPAMVGRQRRSPRGKRSADAVA